VNRAEVAAWLREEDEARLAELWRRADAVRREAVGDEVHLRGLVEVSNHCVRRCAYCGINAGNRELVRYRMGADEILDCARQAAALGYGTVVLQGGEDPGLTRAGVAEVVRRIKAETCLAVTLSLGERSDADLAVWREAGADRYLLRFETSDPELFERIHPPLPARRRRGSSGPSRLHARLALLSRLRALGYEPGSGVMIGIPGQTWDTLACDLETFRALDLDMIGVGPYLPHPATVLGRGELPPAPPGEQVPGSEAVTYRVVALARVLCPQANIPSTTALATVNRARGRELALLRGANVVMPNLTPEKYRALYEIYPDKACLRETATACGADLRSRIEALGRRVGSGPGSRRRA